MSFKFLEKRGRVASQYHPYDIYSKRHPNLHHIEREILCPLSSAIVGKKRPDPYHSTVVDSKKKTDPNLISVRAY
jgi:hypothetical protein